MTDLAREIRELEPWFHNLHLPDGTQTCPDHRLGDFPAFKWRALEPHVPQNLAGKTVLDIGCNAGFYSIELARRGATVTALDSSAHYLNQARWAARHFGVSDRISFEQKQLYRLATTEKTWDLVLFLGVLYHLRYPMLGLDIVSRCVGETLVVQSMTAPGVERDVVPKDMDLLERDALSSPEWPKLSFIEHRLAADPSNWWAPNGACLEAMLRSSGLSVVARASDDFYVCTPDRGSASSMWRWNAAEYWAAVGPRTES